MLGGRPGFGEAAVLPILALAVRGRGLRGGSTGLKDSGGGVFAVKRHNNKLSYHFSTIHLALFTGAKLFIVCRRILQKVEEGGGWGGVHSNYIQLLQDHKLDCAINSMHVSTLSYRHFERETINC